VFRVTISDRVLLALLDRGMTDTASRNRTMVAAELSQLLEQWAERWYQERPGDA
jgi:hypothetical protein